MENPEKRSTPKRIAKPSVRIEPGLMEIGNTRMEKHDAQDVGRDDTPSVDPVIATDDQQSVQKLDRSKVRVLRKDEREARQERITIDAEREWLLKRGRGHTE